jgi:proteasome accessory factor B
MSNDDRLPKSLRLAQVQRLLREATRPVTLRELAERCGTTIRTLQRDVLELEVMGVHLERDGRGYRLASGYFLPPLSLTLAEAVSLYLAGCLIVRTSDEHNPVIVQTLRKIGELLPASLSQHLDQRLAELASHPRNEALCRVFEQCARAWATGHRLRIRYRSAAGRSAHEYVVEPYLLQASAPSLAFYLIGYADWFQAVRTFKLERIEHAELLESRFAPPAPAEASQLLRGAWGIIGGDSFAARLRFAPDVARRVRESFWHPSQRLTPEPDGSLVLDVTVGSELELRSWVLGWGRQVEVLKPASFREWVMGEIVGMGVVYGR